MAALSLTIGPLCHKPNLVHSPRNDSRMLTVSCENRDPKAKKEKGLKKLMGGVEKVGKVLQDNLSPKRKGDLKDVTLMSLSFAVYLYMSQKIVCAYCAWMSMPNQPW